MNEFIENKIRQIESSIPQIKGFTDSEKQYIVNSMSNHIRSVNDYCIDNFRLAIKGNLKQEKLYKKDYNSGCCGFYDCEINMKNGVVILFGFNYGH